MNADAQLIIVAAGMGTRLSHPLPKALVPISGTPLIVHTLQAFETSCLTHSAIIVYPKAHQKDFQDALDTAFPKNTCTLIAGGQERADSVANGLKALSPSTTIVLIHDAARPFIEQPTIHASIDTARRDGAATVASACKDTVLEADPNGHLRNTPDRTTLRLCQTPQVFQRSIIEAAYASPTPDAITDDATRVHRMGIPVTIIECSDTNIKITTPQDIEYAEFLLEKKTP